jgi:hypothetical protein
MLDEGMYAKVIGRNNKTVKRVKNNIIRCARLSKQKGFRMLANFVITKETLPSAREVLEFCTEYEIRFAFGPEINGLGKETIKPGGIKMNRHTTFYP